MADVQNIIDYYVNLLIIQYHNKPKAQAMVRLFITELLASGIWFDIRDAYDLETAIGIQLDVLGKYIGIDRYYNELELYGYFAFVDYEEGAPDPGKRGFADYSDWETKEGKWLTYAQVLGVGLALDDDNYRIILKLKIIQNNSNHSHKSIDDSMFRFFGETVWADSEGDMVMYYFVPIDQSEVLKVAIQKKVLPKPMGVRINWLIEYQDKYFGFATYDEDDYSNYKGEGFTTYDDWETKIGQTLKYGNLIGA